MSKSFRTAWDTAGMKHHLHLDDVEGLLEIPISGHCVNGNTAVIVHATTIEAFGWIEYWIVPDDPEEEPDPIHSTMPIQTKRSETGAQWSQGEITGDAVVVGDTLTLDGPIPGTEAGEEKEFTITASGEYEFRLRGGGGGGINEPHRSKGGMVQGKLNLSVGDVVKIMVGKAGQYNSIDPVFGGGGRGGTSQASAEQHGSSGGGATILYINDVVKMVAGGGGGSAGNGDSSSRRGGGGGGGGGYYGGGGGAGGNEVGGGGTGGTQDAGGVGGGTAGTDDTDGGSLQGGAGGDSSYGTDYTTAGNIVGGDAGGQEGQNGTTNTTSSRANAGGGGSSFTDAIVMDAQNTGGENAGDGQFEILSNPPIGEFEGTRISPTTNFLNSRVVGPERIKINIEKIEGADTEVTTEVSFDNGETWQKVNDQDTVKEPGDVIHNVTTKQTLKSSGNAVSISKMNLVMNLFNPNDLTQFQSVQIINLSPGTWYEYHVYAFSPGGQEYDKFGCAFRTGEEILFYPSIWSAKTTKEVVKTTELQKSLGLFDIQPNTLEHHEVHRTFEKDITLQIAEVYELIIEKSIASLSIHTEIT